MSRGYKHLFGPVPSRRLGRSLGVDLTPFKTCTLDCIFCQLGRTTHKTLDRAEYVPVADVEAELDAWIKEDGKAEYITLAGSGEPTLHSRFGEVLQFVHDRTAIPTALLSNGTLFSRPEVREAAKRADMVKLSLSAWDPFSFEHINRPHPELKFPMIVDGYRAFRSGFRGKLWIEVFLIWGTNSVRGDVERIAALVEAIGPDEIHLNTAVRPPAEEYALAVPRKELERLTGLFQPAAKVTAEFSSDKSADVAVNESTILAMLKRRPCTAQQIAEVFGMHLNEVSKYIGKLSRTGTIRAQNRDGGAYYMSPLKECETMRIAIASGKGGTGKTTVAVNLACVLADSGQAVQYLDCDVEEPNGHIFLEPEITLTEPVGIPVPVVDEKKCTGCRKCAEACQYHAIAILKKPLVFPELCHGCGACALVCPEGAIHEENRTIGVVETGRAGNVSFAQGRLNVGEPMAPPLIRAVKKKAITEGVAIMDSPPGTSCPVVTTVRDADYILLVTEPTPFGLNDLKLAVEMIRQLDVRHGVVINRADTGDQCVREYCREEKITILQELPDDRRVAEAYSRGHMAVRVLPEWSDSMLRLWGQVKVSTEDRSRGRQS